MSISPPIRNSLHLNALRAFEAAARLGGFAQAANELVVTPGAIAAQIKILESEYGASLFERHAKGVRLTPLGESVRQDFTLAFDAIEAAARNLRRQAAPQKVHIATSPALAELWLGPRLRQLAGLLGEIDISVTAVEDLPNLKRTPFDVCLFYTDRLEKGQRRILDEEVFPVCAPALAAQLRHPSDLNTVRCIADVVWEDWCIWASTVMPHQSFSARGPGFSLYSIAVQQALLGAGVLIGRRSLVQQHLNSGALIAPFQCPVPLGLTIATWMLPESRNSRAVKAVVDALILVR
ncbi:LysR family transcriptional regulator [Brucella inopinata]|uniref:LysR family transcriptional regulator n=1 Tax=Brucella inopinata TaxID=1218315 RepID=A0AAW7B5Q0_9HYPH|nr:LysR family transcriptional regulator [Brucella inopinata]EFM55071.1 LysR family transcriptional regulator [Brucella inopinata BO1]KEY04227.1 LysR family transcriptional regulator [Brucella suis bv. 4 str. 40]MDL2331896.1 LysR family transcriptional regulator [Brucella inopinata]